MEDQLDLKVCFMAIKKHLKLIIILTIISTLSANLITTYLIKPKYKAGVSVIISEVKSSDPTQQQNTGQNYNDVLMYQKLVKTYGEFAKSRVVAEDVIKELNLNLSAQTLTQMVSVKPTNDTEILNISITSHSAKEACDIANQYAHSLKSISYKIKKSDNVQLLDNAILPHKPNSPKISLITSCAFVCGLVLSIVLSLLLEFLDSTVKNRDDVENYTKLSFMGSLPLENIDSVKSLKKQLSVFYNPKSLTAEAYRTIRTNLSFSSLDNNLSTLVVTSPKPGDGKSTFICNLGISIAQSGKSVLIMDCDFRNPSIHKMFFISNTQGLTNVLFKQKKFEECVYNHQQPGLEIMCSGPIPPNPSELLGGNSFKALLKHLTTMYDVILIDSPSTLLVTDSQILSSICNGTIVIASFGQTEKDDLLESASQLQRVGGKILGVVLNKIPKKEGPYDYKKYYTSYK